MELFYMMNGADVGELSLIKYTLEGKPTLIWHRVGDHGNEWRHALVMVGNVDFYVDIVARGGSGVRRHIAIDDVTIADCTHFRELLIRSCCLFKNHMGYIHAWNKHTVETPCPHTTLFNIMFQDFSCTHPLFVNSCACYLCNIHPSFSFQNRTVYVLPREENTWGGGSKQSVV